MKQDILDYLKKLNVAYIVLNVIMILATIVCLFFATLGSIGFIIISVVLVALCVALRVLYNLKVNMGVVYEIVVSGNTLSFRTKKQYYSYDLNANNCKKVEIDNDKFQCTFENGNEKDVLIFYRYLPFSGYKNVQYTKEDISFFCPEDAFTKIKQKTID